jgi:hypothetical protein
MQRNHARLDAVRSLGYAEWDLIVSILYFIVEVDSLIRSQTAALKIVSITVTANRNGIFPTTTQLILTDVCSDPGFGPEWAQKTKCPLNVVSFQSVTLPWHGQLLALTSTMVPTWANPGIEANDCVVPNVSLLTNFSAAASLVSVG